MLKPISIFGTLGVLPFFTLLHKVVGKEVKATHKMSKDNPSAKKSQLKKVTAYRDLPLKEGAPVILSVNLSSTLVNASF